jgi:hypothetical protein
MSLSATWWLLSTIPALCGEEVEAASHDELLFVKIAMHNGALYSAALHDNCLLLTTTSTYGCAPILPRLHAAPIQQIVQRFPVVVYLITIMDDIEYSADETARQQQEKRCPHCYITIRNLSFPGNPQPAELFTGARGGIQQVSLLRRYTSDGGYEG